MKTATSEKKRTARSASTPSTAQEEAIKILLRQRIAYLENVVTEMEALAQRHLAQGEAYLRRAEAAEAVVRMRDSKISALFRMLIDAKVGAARTAGYVDRVRELDAVTTSPVRNPMPGDYNDVREALLRADDGTFDRMVESMDQATLEKVTGRIDGEQSDIFR